MYKKFFSVFLCLLLCISLSAPRAAATGVTGAALTVAEMAGVVSLIAGSLGIVFTGAGDMHDACEAFVKGLDPNSPAYLALASAVAQGSTIYIAGTSAVNYLGGLVDSVRSFFIPGDSVITEGSGGVSITNLGQIYQGTGVPPDDADIARFEVTSEPIVFRDSSGDVVGSFDLWTEYLDNWSGSLDRYNCYAKFTLDASAYRSVYTAITSTNPYIYLGVDSSNFIVPIVVYTGPGGVVSSAIISGMQRLRFSAVASVSGGGEEPIDIPVFQEAGALAPDLVGGVWDKLAQDAAAQDGNVTIDTNVGTYQGGATGYVDGDPNGVIAAPQAPSLGGTGSTKTETDTSTGTQTQTQTQTGTQAVPNSTTANPAITNTQAKTQFNGATLTLVDIFPFCIPFDIYAMITSLAAARETPTFDVRLFYPGWLDYTYTFDFSDWDNVAAVLRAAELGAFVIGLAAATRKFIKW